MNGLVRCQYELKMTLPGLDGYVAAAVTTVEEVPLCSHSSQVLQSTPL